MWLRWSGTLRIGVGIVTHACCLSSLPRTERDATTLDLLNKKVTCTRMRPDSRSACRLYHN